MFHHAHVAGIGLEQVLHRSVMLQTATIVTAALHHEHCFIPRNSSSRCWGRSRRRVGVGGRGGRRRGGGTGRCHTGAFCEARLLAETVSTVTRSTAVSIIGRIFNVLTVAAAFTAIAPGTTTTTTIIVTIVTIAAVTQSLSQLGNSRGASCVFCSRLHRLTTIIFAGNHSLSICRTSSGSRRGRRRRRRRGRRCEGGSNISAPIQPLCELQQTPYMFAARVPLRQGAILFVQRRLLHHGHCREARSSRQSTCSWTMTAVPFTPTHVRAYSAFDFAIDLTLAGLVAVRIRSGGRMLFFHLNIIPCSSGDAGDRRTTLGHGETLYSTSFCFPRGSGIRL
mmetsp:Transcript_10647/g.17359  ORF Transcript_10647/g.17359 Transcript_10647/m.17359 type:complete len:337 (+) Transcript_10647:392-1402(+)